MAPEPFKRPFVTASPGGLRGGYCKTQNSALVAAHLRCLEGGERRATVTTRAGTAVATITATPMGTLVTMHGTFRLDIAGFRHLKRVA